MPTFKMRDRKGTPVAEFEYTPLRVDVAGVRHELALHCVIANWQVSHPASGAKVCDIQAFWSLNGIRVGSRRLSAREAKSRAKAQVLELAERIGADAFNDRLAKAAAAVAAIA